MANMALYHGIAQGVKTVEATYVEDLFLQVGDNIFETWPIASGQVIEVGHVLGLNEATGKLVICDDSLGATAGLEPYAVALHPINTSVSGLNADSSAAVLVRTMGKLNANVLKFGGTYTADKIRAKLSRRGISIDTPGY